MLTYTVELQPQLEGGYTVIVPALPGCVTQGDSIGEALTMAQDAIVGYLTVLAKHKRKIPIEASKLRRVSVSFKKQTRVRELA